MTLISALFGAIFCIMLGLVLSVSGLMLPTIDQYKAATPKADIRNYLNGSLVAFGNIQDITGRVVAQFTADIQASWQGNTGTMVELFTYDDGSTEQRTWHFSVNDDGSFTGTAGDIIGEVKGEQQGNAIFARYILQRTINGRTLQFSMDDRLYQIDDTHLINQIRMRKFGVTVATLNIAFYKK